MFRIYAIYDGGRGLLTPEEFGRLADAIEVAGEYAPHYDAVEIVRPSGEVAWSAGLV